MAHTFQQATPTPVADLRPGDLVNLEGDRVADAGPHPHEKAAAGTATDYDSHRLAFEFEYSEVYGVEVETPDCVRVDFVNGFSVGFPTAHRLAVVARYHEGDS